VLKRPQEAATNTLIPHPCLNSQGDYDSSKAENAKKAAQNKMAEMADQVPEEPGTKVP
jgi:hypothetical protein